MSGALGDVSQSSLKHLRGATREAFSVEGDLPAPVLCTHLLHTEHAPNFFFFFFSERKDNNNNKSLVT